MQCLRRFFNLPTLLPARGPRLAPVDGCFAMICLFRDDFCDYSLMNLPKIASGIAKRHFGLTQVHSANAKHGYESPL